MTTDAHNQLFHLANEHLTNGRHNDALAVFAQLLDSDLDEFGKAMACINMAIILDQLGQVLPALDAYDRGIAFEQSLGRYDAAQRKVAYCIEKDRYGDALAAISALIAGGISEMDKSTLCLSAATVCEKMGQPDRALEWYERGIKYERPHHRHIVAEHKAWYLSSKGRNKESLMLYDRLALEPSMTEVDKDRLKEAIRVLSQ